MSTSRPLLSVEGLHLQIHGTSILTDVSLSLQPGQTLGVIGESGSGKSLTALSVMQLLPRGSTSQGRIHFQGQDLQQLSEPALCRLRGGDIGMVFQEPMTALNPVKSIGDQVSESIRLHQGLTREQAWSQAQQTLERVGLPPARFALSRYPHELSGGQRQRVVIAIAVACKPRLLIADEPTTALDVTTQAGILELLRSLQREEGLGLMLISHDLAVVSNMADDVVVMRQGKIVEQGTLDAVFGRPSHAYTRLLFEASALTQLARHASVEHRTAATKNAAQDRVAELPDSVEPSGEPQAPAEKPPLLQVEDLVCEYPGRRRGLFSHEAPFRAVDGVSFHVGHGESVALVGESGCGKSTLTRALLGLMPLRSGAIRLDGESVSGQQRVSRRARQQMQVVFQDPYGSFNPRHRVSRLVAEPLHVLDASHGIKAIRQRVLATLESVGLQASDADKYIHEFSGGQRQRIAIARALIIQPAMIVLDEAVSALDVSVRAQILQLLASLAREQSLAYLFISHDLSVVRRVSERVLVMQQGRIVEQGDTTALFEQPRHAYTQQLLAATPVLRIGDQS